MAISTEQVYLLNNKSGKVANYVQLGTLIQNAESITAGEVDLAEGKVFVGNASDKATATTMTSGQILVGDASSVATAVSVTGDVTLSNAGVTAIAAGAIVNADVNASAAIAVSKLEALNSARVWVGNGSNVAVGVDVTGDVTISNAGVTAIAAGAIVDADVNASAAIAVSKLEALNSARVWVGNGSNVAVGVDVTGDVTISNAGVTAIAAGAIVDADVNATAAIATTKLAGATHTTEGLNKLELMAVAIYDFAVDGGAQSTIGSGVTLPDNAVVTRVVEDVYTALTSAGSGATIKLTLPTDGDLSADVTADGTNVAVASVLPSGTPVKTTAARELSFVIGTEAITAGAVRYFVFYVQSV